MNRQFAEMVALVGHRVVATLDEGPPPVTETGHLVAISDHGDMTIKREDGSVVYCWPALRLHEAAQTEETT
jgi:hypothetical protein